MVALEEDPVLRSRLDLLMDHHKERKEEKDNWARTILQVIEPIRNRLNCFDWSEDFIQHCVGLIRTNATQILATGCTDDKTNIEDGKLTTLRVLYPSMSPMSHSCIPNTRIIHRSDYILEARTMKEVRQGEEFTISYTGNGRCAIRARIEHKASNRCNQN
jgi:hypothetical protein